MYLVRVDNGNTARVSLDVSSTTKGAQDIPGELVRHVGGSASGGAGGQRRADRSWRGFLRGCKCASGTLTAMRQSGKARGQVGHQETGADVVSHKGRVGAGQEKRVKDTE
jgi:hypothetical protein